MTDRQAAILNYVESHIAQHGYPPSIRDITRECGHSTTSVTAHHLHVLIREGKLNYTPGIARSLTLGCRAPLVEGLRTVEGSIEQGRPAEALATLRGLLSRLGGQG